MVTLFMRHPVASYPTWRKVFDEYIAAGDAMGVTAHAIYQGIANSNDVTLALDFDRLETAQVFLIREDLKTMMQKGGAGAPTVWFASRM